MCAQWMVGVGRFILSFYLAEHNQNLKIWSSSFDRAFALSYPKFSHIVCIAWKNRFKLKTSAITLIIGGGPHNKILMSELGAGHRSLITSADTNPTPPTQLLGGWFKT